MEKCVCGHTVASEGEKKFDETITDEMVNAEPFIRIEGSFHKVINSYFRDEVRVNLYACPKCGTVKIFDP